jgi:hypothetical protein
MSARPKRSSKTPTRFNPEAGQDKADKVEKKKKVPVKKTRVTKKAKKDPNAPKRARTGYIIFATEVRPQVKAVRPHPMLHQRTSFISFCFSLWNSPTVTAFAPKDVTARCV